MKSHPALINRRAMVAGSLGAGFALPALAAEGLCAKKPGTPPALEPERLLSDWAWLARYRDENGRLIASGAKVHAVFLGDSITEGWRDSQPEFFAAGNVCRGI